MFADPIAREGSLWAYRFYPADRDRRALIPTSEEALRWDPAFWGPGDTLVWHIARDGGWELRFDQPEEALPFVAEALSYWSDVSTADIVWRVEGVAGTGRGRDGRNTVLVDPDASGAYASHWLTWHPRLGWRIKECDVGIGPWFLERLGREDPSFVPPAPNATFGMMAMVHEFGHCIGLAHHAATPAVQRFWTMRRGDYRESSVWGDGSIMGSGGEVGARYVTEDDAVGASLLRPARGWLQTTGSVSGELRLADEPAAFSVVGLVRKVGGTGRGAYTVFSDEEGHFRLDGVAPGDYFLHVYPMIQYRAHPRLVRAAPPPLFDEILVPRPIRVHAGKESAAPEFLLRGERAP